MTDLALHGDNLAAQVIESLIGVEPAAQEPVATLSGEPAKFEFDASFQTTIAAMCVCDSEFLSRVDGLIKPEYFERATEATLVGLALAYFQKYRCSPSKTTFIELFKEAAKKKQVRSDMIPELKESIKAIFGEDIHDRNFVIDKIEAFAQERAWEAAILNSMRHLEKRQFDRIRKEIDEATLVGAADDLGAYDYFANIEARTLARNERAAGILPPKGIPTGIRALDEALYHCGWGRRELSVLMGAAKAGKSMALLEFGKNAALNRYNVLYLTLEVDSEVLADRLDANLGNYLMRELTHKGSEAEEHVKRAAANAGKFIIHRYPPGSLTPSDIRRLLQRYKAKSIVFDMLVVDYGDLMAPDVKCRDNPIEDSKNVWTGLRAIATDENLACLTATQTNRDGAKASVAKATDVAEDFNKIRIADIVISINRTEEEKTKNEARLHFAASRNQGDAFTLRINQDLERGRFITKILGAV